MTPRTDQPAVEQHFHLVLALLPSVRHSVRASLSEGVDDVGARAGGHCEEAVPPRAQLIDVDGVRVEQLLGSRQDPEVDRWSPWRLFESPSLIPLTLRISDAAHQ